MPHVPKMQAKRSAWTPLNHAPSNSQLFEERRALLAKWFSCWTDAQKKAVLQDLIQSCSLDQLLLLSLSVSRQLPLQATDFTGMLPRALCLYIFSFLDPRSLCRCAQVSWHWKNTVELDQLWMSKCLRRGWCINYCPSPFEQAVWKRHYIQTVQQLRLSTSQSASSQQQSLDTEVTKVNGEHEELRLEDALLNEPRPESNSSSRRRKETNKPPTALPPWRDSDRHPKDIVRFNYLDNPHSMEESLTVKTQRRGPTCRNNPTTSSTRTAYTATPDEPRNKTVSEANYKLRKAKSLMFLSSNSRPAPLDSVAPPWTDPRALSDVTPESVKRLLRLSQWNAGIRPGPVRSPVPRLSVQALRASQRSHRSVPSVPLFNVIQPWTVPPSLTGNTKQ